MSKRLGIALSDEAWSAVESLLKEANDAFEGGRVGVSDAISEMILCSRVDVCSLQLKHMDLRKSLKSLASKKDLDLESVLKMLADLKGKPLKKKGNIYADEEV